MDTFTVVEVLVVFTVAEVAGLPPPEHEKTAGPGAVYVVCPAYRLYVILQTSLVEG